MGPKNKKPQESPLEITNVRSIRPDEIVEVMKELARKPKDYQARLLWEDNGMPRKRTEEELNQATADATTWAANELAAHNDCIKSDPIVQLISAQGRIEERFIQHLSKTLELARFYEQTDYLRSASFFYTQAAEHLMFYRKNINSSTLEWCKNLIDRADTLYKTHRGRGGYDNEFAPVHEDIQSVDEKANLLIGLGAEEINRINSRVDMDSERYAPNAKQSDIIHIENQECHAFAELKHATVKGHNYVALLFAQAAESAIGAGSRDWAAMLFAEASKVYGKYTEWQRSQGVTPNTSGSISAAADPRLHDMYLVHKTLANLKKKIKGI